MSDKFVGRAQENMGAIEQLLKGLPGISGYVDKDLRRDADKRLRTMIAQQLTSDKQRLLDVQKKLLKSGGLAWLDDVDESVQKLQILIDRIKTASYGYAGLFDPVKIQADELNALHRFDVAMAGRMGEVDAAISALDAAAGTPEVGEHAASLAHKLAELNRLFDKRHEAIVAPELLLEPDYVPEVDEALLDAAGQ